MTQTDPEFCGDLRTEINKRTEDLLADPDRDFAEKASALQQISTFRLMYNPRDRHRSIKYAATKGRMIAALVHCDTVPNSEAVFIGKLAEGDPLTLTRDGVQLAIKSGLLARASVGNNGHNYRFGVISALYEDEGFVSVTDEPLRVIKNRLIPAVFRPNPMTRLADETLAQIEGLDFKICYEDVNVPGVDEHGQIKNVRHDRLNLLGAFGGDGGELYVRLFQEARDAVNAG